MLIDKLDEVVRDLEEYDSLKKIADNKERQNVLEKTLDDILREHEGIIEIVIELFERLNIIPSYRIIEEYEEFNLNLIESYKNQMSDAINNKKLADSSKNIDEWCRQEWNVYYEANSSEQINILNTIIEITPNRDKTAQVINKILQGKKVIDNKKNLAMYISGIEEAKMLKESLRLEPNIIEFLSKVNAKQVSLFDLTESIDNWIKREGLEKKFKIVF